MDWCSISDDFFTINGIPLIKKDSHNAVYDFDFRNNFSCRSVITKVDAPILLHIGAIENYADIEVELKSSDMRLLIPEEEHLRCSMIEQWYPILKEHTHIQRYSINFPRPRKY